MSKSNLQIILLVIFVVGLLVAVAIFSGFIPIKQNSQTAATGDVVLWGTVKKDLIVNILDEFNRNNKTYRVIYVEKNPQTLDSELVEALASGVGPDLFFLTDDLIVRHSDKVFVTPYATFPEKTFRDTFASAGELYLTKTGILAWPFIIDPMVMYYNRDLIEGAGVVKPPEFWSAFPDFAKIVTQRGQSGNILKSAVSFGEYSNVAYAKDIFAAMLLQRGNTIVGRNDTGYFGKLGDNLGESITPTESILAFYTSFSNPIKEFYSWAKSMPYSRDAFISGDLATYFGYASELLNIQAKNPNLNYDLAKIPQVQNGKTKATIGKVLSIAISKNSKNLSTAYVAATAMTGADFAGKVSTALGLPPARRDLLVLRPVTPYYMPIFYDSALISRSWLDPSERETDNIFKNMIDDVSSGRLSTGESAIKASDQLNLLIRPQ